MNIQYFFIFLLISAFNLNALNDVERDCFDSIFRPAERAHNIIYQRVIDPASASAMSSNDDDSSDTHSATDPNDLEIGVLEIPSFGVDPSIVKILAQQLSNEEIVAIGTMMGRLTDYLILEEQFHQAYHDQLKNIRYTMLVGTGSLIVFLLALVPLGLAQLGQMTCDDYECVYDDDSMIITDNGDGPTHYCGHDGQDFDCLQFYATALGHVDLRNATYKPGCSKFLNESSLNEAIPLAEIKHFTNTTCQVLVGLIPLLDAACLALPTAVAGYTVKKGFDLKKLRRKVEAIKQEPVDFDSWPFRTGIVKLDNISPRLKTYVELAGSTFGIGNEMPSPIGMVFRNSPFHLLVEELLQRAGFGSTIKAAWRSF